MEEKTFRDAYEVLQRHAETLRNQDEPNIDDLLDIVNESVSAYKVCKQRIDAVEKALEEALVGAGLEGAGRGERGAPPASSETGSRGRPATARGYDDEDDDRPF
ncbi:exodeoxyribonuclease VII small subunit [Paucibacter sp. M5-1]|uniref:exodeoxyribonuclease VII small subunit n=1 Tax=Paucibacter sp. M5-1 TaxID=3015998 RepID=UPI0022B936A9|nr:exodeoxyribonuclease VII small subunit [Paucibacter sp. M5-1]MCZ7884626.1 exodeoxyribonuclease VII small subunit [Paucibacter sp. M5-1]